MACDHSQPVCRRCIKRKQEQDCVYIVSGHGQVKGNTSRSPRVHSTPSSPLTGSSSVESARVGHLKAPEPQRTTPAITNPGYLGFTSFCGVYAETENSLLSLSQLHGRMPASSDDRYSDVRENNTRGPTFHKYRERPPLGRGKTFNKKKSRVKTPSIMQYSCLSRRAFLSPTKPPTFPPPGLS